MSRIIKIFYAVIFSLSVYLIAQAQEDSFKYPIAELGNCGNKQECRNFCSQEENFESCAAFAEKHNLLPTKGKQKKEVLKEVLKNKGPGGCEDREACEAYCEAEEHQNECLAFAEKHGLIPEEELKQAKKFIPLMKQGQTPGGCKSKQACEAYCHSEDHMEECLEFGRKHGLISKEDEERANKFLPLMKTGQTPGGCKSKEQCEAYCHTEEHFEECVEFGLKIGAMSEEEAAMAKKTKGRGPGNCKGREECEAFCNNPDNQETCFQFAKEHGMMKDEDMQRMKEGMGQMRMGLANAPEEVKECLKQNVDEGTLDGIEKGSFSPTSEIGGKVRECFEKFRPQLEEHRRGQFQTSPEIEDCLKSTVGEEVLSKIKTGEAPPSPELGEQMRSCFEQFGGPPAGKEGFGGESHGFDAEKFNAPEPVKKCLMEKLGAQEGASMEQVRPIMEECFHAQSGQDQQGQRPPPEMLGQPVEGGNYREGQDFQGNQEGPNAPYYGGTKYERRPYEGQRQPYQNPQEGQYRQYPPRQEGKYQQYPSTRSGSDGQNPPPGGYTQPPPDYQRPPEGQAPLPDGGTYPPTGSGSYVHPPQDYQQSPPPAGSGTTYQQPPPPTAEPPPPPPPPPSGEVQGASTSRLPGFIRWLLGR